MDISQRGGLESLCATAEADSAIQTFLDDVAETKFRLRTGGVAGKDEDEWFDREYLRIGRWLPEQNVSGDYTVVFAKPGMGYYACIVIHRGDLVTKAWFEDKSS